MKIHSLTIRSFHEPGNTDGKGSHLLAIVTVRNEQIIIERFSDMPVDEWSEVPIGRIVRAKVNRKARGNSSK